MQIHLNRESEGDMFAKRNTSAAVKTLDQTAEEGSEASALKACCREYLNVLRPLDPFAEIEARQCLCGNSMLVKYEYSAEILDCTDFQ